MLRILINKIRRNRREIKDSDFELLKSLIKENRKRYKDTSKKSNDFEDVLFNLMHESQRVDDDIQNLFHRLNYQRVVDKMNKDIRNWKIGIFVFALGTIAFLYLYGTFHEEIVTRENALHGYNEMISAVDFEVNYKKEIRLLYPQKDRNGNVDSTYAEAKIVDAHLKPSSERNTAILAEVTESYFTMYFLRYILIRILVIAVLITLITSSIKVYMRMRKDRMNFLVKEEATTATLYLFKKFLSKSGAKEFSAKDKERIASILPEIINELYYLPNSKDLGKEKFSVIHKMMGIMEKMVSNMGKSGSRGSVGATAN